MTEIALRATAFESELLTRHCATDLAHVNARQLEAYRVSAGIHVTDPSWLLLVERWHAAAPANQAMNVSELETLPDGNLYALMSGDAVHLDVKQNAALELYRRGSKFIHAPEFAVFKTFCIDRELQELKGGHAPERVLDGLQRLFEKSEDNRAAIGTVDNVHTRAESELLTAITNAVKTLRSEADAQGSSLQQKIANVHAALSKAVKKLAIWLGSVSLVSLLAIVLHLVHVL